MPVVSMKANEKWTQQLRDILLRNVSEILKIDKSGGIAILVWNPGEEWKAGLHKMKWDGTDKTVIRMPRWFRNNLKATDSATKKWVKRKKAPVRIFVINGPGTLLLNLRRGEGEGPGLWIEPGSTDHDLAEELGLGQDNLIVVEDRA